MNNPDATLVNFTKDVSTQLDFLIILFHPFGVAILETHNHYFVKKSAPARTRTADLFVSTKFNSELLYLLSY